MNSQGSSCLTCQHHLKHSTIAESLTGLPTALVSQESPGLGAGLLGHFIYAAHFVGRSHAFWRFFKTPTYWVMTQKFISLPRIVPLNTGCLDTPTCLLVLQA